MHCPSWALHSKSNIAVGCIKAGHRMAVNRVDGPRLLLPGIQEVHTLSCSQDCKWMLCSSARHQNQALHLPHKHVFRLKKTPSGCSCSEFLCPTYIFGKLSLVEGPPVALIVCVVQPDVGPRHRAQNRAIRAQGQGLDAPLTLIVVDGLSTCLCAPQVHTASNQNNAQLAPSNGFLQTSSWHILGSRCTNRDTHRLHKQLQPLRCWPGHDEQRAWGHCYLTDCWSSGRRLENPSAACPTASRHLTCTWGFRTSITLTMAVPGRFTVLHQSLKSLHHTRCRPFTAESFYFSHYLTLVSPPKKTVLYHDLLRRTRVLFGQNTECFTHFCGAPEGKKGYRTAH